MAYVYPSGEAQRGAETVVGKRQSLPIKDDASLLSNTTCPVSSSTYTQTITNGNPAPRTGVITLCTVGHLPSRVRTEYLSFICLWLSTSTLKRATTFIFTLFCGCDEGARRWQEVEQPCSLMVPFPWIKCSRALPPTSPSVLLGIGVLTVEIK